MLLTEIVMGVGTAIAIICSVWLYKVIKYKYSYILYKKYIKNTKLKPIDNIKTVDQLVENFKKVIVLKRANYQDLYDDELDDFYNVYIKMLLKSEVIKCMKKI